MKQRTVRREADLDVVRGIAILLAMGWHLNNGVDQPGVVHALLAPGRTFGWAGVDLFFVLSGFLIGRIVLLEQVATGGFDPRRFLLRRVLRLWPVLYLYLAMQLLFGDKPWRSFLPQNLVHIQNYTGTSLAHLWSLAVEEHFYLVFAVIYAVFLARSFSHRKLIAGLLATMALALGFRAIAAAAGVDPVSIQWESHFRMDSLACGLLLATLSVHEPALFARLNGARWATAALVIGCVAYLSLVPQYSALNNVLGYSITTLGAAAFVLLLHRSALTEKVPLLARPLAALSGYAYALYIWHISAARLIEIVLRKLHLDLPPEAVVGLRYLGAIAVAVAVSTLVERPFMALRNRILPSSDPVRPPEPQADLLAPPRPAG